jgi:HAD superfamily hydrolase (TIGR01509 family)
MIGERIEGVLLDMGGVVLHMAGGSGFPIARLDWRGRQAMVETVRRAGGRVTLDRLDELVFIPWAADYGRREETGREADWRPHLERLRAGTRCAVHDIDLLSAWFEPYAEQLVPLADVGSALAALSGSARKLAVVSNVPLPGELYVRVLERHGLLQHFDHLVFSYDAGTRKPSPAMLRKAMARLGVEPGATIMVGDRRERDIAAGRFAGVRTVWVRSDDSGGPEPDVTIDSLAELPGLLEPRGG